MVSTNTLTLAVMVGGYITQYHLDTLINRYFIGIDIFDNVHPPPTRVSQSYMYIETVFIIFLEMMDAKLNICGSIGLDVNNFIMLPILHLRRTCTLNQENPCMYLE